jgi:hypothetical protein
MRGTEFRRNYIRNVKHQTHDQVTTFNRQEKAFELHNVRSIRGVNYGTTHWLMIAEIRE